jgi:hypothetical protein
VAVEVKSWQHTFNADWYQALGQYLTYQDVLIRKVLITSYSWLFL